LTEPIYIARASVEKVDRSLRRAHLESGPVMNCGVHGPIKRMYKLDDLPDQPLPIDYVVGATGACMLGTLNGGLQARGFDLPPEAITAEVEGIHEMRDGGVVLSRIIVHYQLRIPAASREAVDRLLSKHQEKCPTAQSLKGAIDVSWTADIHEQ
jgi:uncharacterized OsmC-like protein